MEIYYLKFMPNKIKLDKIKKKLEKMPWMMAERAFLTCLAFLFLALILGGIVFYKYGISAQKADTDILQRPVQFNKRVFQDVLYIWKEREESFQGTDLKEYSNPFQKNQASSD